MNDTGDLRDELRALRERVEAIERRLGMAADPVSAENPAIAKPTPVEAPRFSQQPQPDRAERSPGLETRLGLTWINRIGVITLLFGAGFFFKYAVENEWIGPVARVILGITAGLAALGAGDFLHRRNQRLFAQGISGLGIALLYLSFYAASQFYHLIPDIIGFAALAFVTALGAALAIQYDAMPVAALGFFGGYLTPVLVAPALWVLYGYTLLLDVAAVMLARARGWRPLEIFAIVATALLYTTANYRHESLLGTLFIAAAYALFSVAQLPGVRIAAQLLASIALAFLWTKNPSGFLLCSFVLAAAGVVTRPIWALGGFWLGYALWTLNATARPDGPVFVAITLVFVLFFALVNIRPGSVSVVAANGPIYFGAAYLLLNPHHHAFMGLLAVSLAAAHLITARHLLTVAPQMALLSTGLAAVFVTLAIPVQLAGYAITIAWATEAAALAWIASRWKDARAIWLALAILALILMHLAVFDRESSDSRLITFTASAIAFWLTAKWMQPGRLAAAVYIIGHALMLWGLGLEIERWALQHADPQNVVSVTTAAISIMLAAYAVIVIGAGVLTATTINRFLGLALIGIVILKLYLYDVWLLGRLYRTIAFVALGALLVLSSYVYSRYRERVEGWWTNNRL